MTQSLIKTVADFETTLATQVTAGATTATLSSITDDDGVVLANGTYGFTFDGDVADAKEYIVATLTGTALSSVTSVSRQGVATTGFAKFHRRGATVSVTDWATLSRINNVLDGTTNFDAGTHLGYDAAPAGLTGNQFATVTYVLGVVSGGTVTFDQQVASNQVLGETIAVNDFVYFKESDHRWWKTDADLIATFSNLKVGISKTAGSAGTTATIAVSGTVSGFTGLTAGSKYYLSNTAGAIGTTAGTFSAPVGWALSTTTFFLDVPTAQLPSVNQQAALVGRDTPSGTNQYATFASLKFGGNGTDGVLNVTSGTTTINLGGAAVVVKNYTSMSISVGATVNFSNPNAGGTIIILKSQGNVNIAGTLNASGMGAAAGTQPTGRLFGETLSATNGSTTAGGTVTNSSFYLTNATDLYRRNVVLVCGGGGAQGQVGAAGAGGL